MEPIFYSIFVLTLPNRNHLIGRRTEFLFYEIAITDLQQQLIEAGFFIRFTALVHLVVRHVQNSVNFFEIHRVYEHPHPVILVRLSQVVPRHNLQVLEIV